LVRTAKAVGIRVSIVPQVMDVVGHAVVFDDVLGMMLLGVRSFSLSRSTWFVKRSMDIVGASVGLIVLAPVFLAVAIAIRLDSRGPVLFRQPRVGRDDGIFQMFKFRSMVIDAEQRKDDLFEIGQRNGLFKLDDDPRITRVGRWLRCTSLDELPQLFNVLRGEMSLVGPRPLIASEDLTITGYDRHRLKLTPGMTGPWQLMGYRVPLSEMVKVDYLYVTGWSLMEDVGILLRTVRHVLLRRGI
jgi:lipopolysaccharide/colanic/teichoic acid biosynthesis glycosyltransferase